MNLADLCPEGREKYAECQHYNSILYSRPLKRSEQREYANAWQAYQEHKRTCEFCKEE